MYSLTYILSLWITWLAYPSSYNLTGSIILTSSCSSCRSCLSTWYAYITRSVTLSPPSLALSLKILPIFRLSTRGIVSFYLICCYPSLMPPSIASVHCITLITFILSTGKVIPSCSCYIEKGLVCVTITALSGRQPLSCVKCIKANMHLSCNIYSISNTKCIYYPILLSCLIPYLNCHRVLNSIRH